MEPLWDRLRELRMPVTVLVGERDERYVALGERVAAGCREARVEVVPGAGHALVREVPAAVAAAIASPVWSVRDGTPADGAMLAALHRRSSLVWAEHRADLLAHPEVFAQATEALAEGRARVAVGRDGVVLGFSSVLAVAAGACELDALFVEPDTMAQRVGRVLLLDVVHRARAAGAIRITVVAGPAAGFYERYGFRDVGAAETQFGRARQLELRL